MAAVRAPAGPCSTGFDQSPLSSFSPLPPPRPLQASLSSLLSPQQYMNLTSSTRFSQTPFAKSKGDLQEIKTLRQSSVVRKFRISGTVMNASQVVEEVRPSPAQDITTVDVELGDRSYPIYIGSGLLNKPHLLQKHVKGMQVLVVTNTTIAPLFLEKVIGLLKHGISNIHVENVILPDGEEYKNMETLMMVFDKAIKTRMDRKCTFIALGGGVIGDMCGFAAASYLRGVNFIQIPTTLMAQVDSSVGGKTGVNHPLGKNLIGAFYQPQCVLIDTDTLNSLPNRELASGIAEVIKYGLIRDAVFFQWLESNIDSLIARDSYALAYAVKRSCENKAEVVSSDEKEGGLRAILNLGHTFGHVSAKSILV